MREMTLDDLTRVIRATVGVDDSVDLDADIRDTEFAELGYDSLAVLEVVSRLEKEFPASVPEEKISELRTPRELIDYVNSQLTAAA
ncbi:act minimal PKS acyl carrier protein [Micromonospora pallida]|uniref:Act minimal PKS acyl carrier protein n=1 Tax=Micromonospora pallida TaxID=145854 RepID=A0A1C6SPP1_9ACTN|nr:acyl carrier protein [Micromonospora pallida]SCL31458.1 act minimal PKS acyl carrier protein [Micromonospora pallida]